MPRSEYGDKVTEPWELVRRRRLRDARKARIEARKDEGFRKRYGFERPTPEFEGKLIVFDFQRHRIIERRDRDGNPIT